MTEYIKREDAYATLTDYYHHSTETQHMALKEALDRVPAADVRPVVRGKWELHRENQNGDNWDRWVCSKCGYVAAKGWEHTRYGAKPKYNFCPNCGAMMEES